MSESARNPVLDRSEPLVPRRLIPPAEFSLMDLPVTGSVRRAFHDLGVRTGPDFSGITVAAFLGCQGIGKGKVHGLRAMLSVAAGAGWPWMGDEPETVTVEPTTREPAAVPERPALYACERPLIDFLAENLRLLPEREAAVLASRFCLDGPRDTFAELGARFGVTDARAQQFFVRAYRMLGHRTRCWESVRSAFSEMVPMAPLRVEEVARCPWTSGLPYNALIQLAVDVGGLHLVPVRGIGPCLLPFPGKDLARVLVELKSLVAHEGSDGSVDALLEEVAGLLGEPHRAVCGRVLEAMFRGCDALGAMIVLGMDGMAVATLVPEGCVVGLEEAVARVRRAMPDPPTPASLRRLMNIHAVQNGKDRFARIPDRESGRVVAQACHDAVMAGSPGRRWRLHELRTSLACIGMPFAEIPSELELASILTIDRRLVRVQGDVWCDMRDPDHGGGFIGTVELVLERNGGPLANMALMEEVGRLWGVVAKPQVTAVGAVVQTRRGVWGLAHRDLPLDASERKEAARCAEASLAAGVTSAKAIHAGLPVGLSGRLADECTLVSILREFGFRTNQYGELRQGRHAPVHAHGTVAWAVEAALRKAPDGLTLDQAQALAESATGKPVLQDTVLNALKQHGARIPAVRGRWVYDGARGLERGAPASGRHSFRATRREFLASPKSRGAVWTERNLATIEAMLADGRSTQDIHAALDGAISMPGLVSKLNRMGHTFKTRRTMTAGIRA